MVNTDVESGAAQPQILSSPEEKEPRRGQKEVEGRHPQLLFVDLGSRGRASTSTEIVALLESRGFQVRCVESAGEAIPTLGRTPPELLVLAVSEDSSAESCRPVAELRAAVRNLGIPVLEVLDAGNDLGRGSGPSPEADDWVQRGCTPDELATRVARLLRRRERNATSATRSSAVPVDPWFISLVVHDLRTPLNVIGLSFWMIEQVLPKNDPDTVEDARFIAENLRQLEQMLFQLGEYSRLSEPRLNLSVSEFSPRRLIEELLENREGRPGGKKPSVWLDIQKTCPEEVALDQVRARLAIDYALTNACAAALDGPVRIILRGRPQRWIIEVAVDRPPPSSVSSIDLRPHLYEHLCGSEGERRGMDLAIAARVSALFGGSARLEADQGRGTSIILDWPARIADGPASA